MTKSTMEQKILSIVSDDWQPSWNFVKVNTPLGWLGTSGDRILRYMVEEGTLERKREGKYSYFRLTRKENLF
jgi:predicted transcriptional regulator